MSGYRLLLFRLTAGILIAVAVSIAYHRQLWEKIELITYDWRLKTATSPGYDEPPQPLVIVGITQEFKDKIGEDFSRKHYARIIRILTRENASVVGSDIFFPDMHDSAEDREMVAAIRANGKIVLPIFSPGKLTEDKNGFFRAASLRGSARAISDAAYAFGHINAVPDFDQVIRRIPLFITCQDRYFPHIGVEMIRASKGVGRIPPDLRHGLTVPGTAIPLDTGVGLNIHYLPPQTMSRYLISFEDVLLGNYPKGFFSRKAVLIGQTILGAKNADLVPTPYGTQYGVMLQGSALWTMLSGRYIHRLNQKTVILLTLLTGILLALLTSFRVWYSTAAFLLFSLAVFYGSRACLGKYGLFLDITPMLVVAGGCYVASLGFSLRNALVKIFQKETAFHVLEDAEREITNLLKPAEFFGLAQNFTFSGFQTENLLKQTPGITLHTLLASLGISSGVLLFASVGKKQQEIAAYGGLCQKADITFLAAQVLASKRPFIVNNVTRKHTWAHSSDIGNVMAVPIIAQPTFSIIGVFFNKLPTVFSDTPNFTADDVRLTETLSLQAIVAIQNANLNLALKDAQLETIFRLAVAIEFRDRETGMHIHRVSEYAAVLADGMNLPPAEVELIKSAMPMHDIGKIAIPDHILLKPGRLTAEERTIINKHTIVGAKMLEGSSSLVLQAAEIIALNHQERFDGSGYPHRLAGNAIPIYGRIAAMVDIFDALSSKRIYKEAVDFKESLIVLTEERGKSIDPKMADLFFSRKDEIERIYNSYRETESPEFLDILK